MENMDSVQMELNEREAEETRGADPNADAPETQPRAEKEKSEFQRLIEGKYKQEYEAAVGKRIQSAIQQRFKNQADWRAALEAYRPIVRALGQKYGLDEKDTEAIARRVTEELGPEKENAANNNESARAAFFQRHFNSLLYQASLLRREVPSFDLSLELQNPRFRQMTMPGTGVNVRDAFYALHGRDLQRAGMRYAAQQAQERLAASVRAGASRPMENGMQSPGAVSMEIDIRSMDKKTREEYKRRIRNGESINFSDKV